MPLGRAAFASYVNLVRFPLLAGNWTPYTFPNITGIDTGHSRLLNLGLACFASRIPIRGQMSSDDDYEQELDRKRRRVQRACDFCRRRKSRCDGAQMAGNKCTSCLNAKIDCTYDTPVTTGVLSGLGIFVWLIGGSYVDSLEARLDHSEALVRQLRNELANTHFASTSNTTPKHSLNSSTETVEENVGGSEQVDLLNVSLAVMRNTLRAIAAPPAPPHADDLLHLELVEK
ncbi:hypothetical protein B0H14DRAFT_3131498, partial [Mycena olivaceomarginata]